MQLSPFPCHLVPLRSKCSPQNPILKHPQPAFLPQCQRPGFTPTQLHALISQIYALISQIYFGMKLYMFRTVLLSIIRSFPLYTQQWYMSYRTADSLQTGSGWKILILFASCQHILILYAICQQTCMTYTIAVCTVKNSWWWREGLSETYRVSFQNKFEKLVHLGGFVYKKFITMPGHMSVKLFWFFGSTVKIFVPPLFQFMDNLAVLRNTLPTHHALS
jgi:hypothetical protein